MNHGDIVRSSGEQLFVYLFNQYVEQWMLRRVDPAEAIWFKPSEFEHGSLTVVGNIFESKNLNPDNTGA